MCERLKLSTSPTIGTLPPRTEDGQRLSPPVPSRPLEPMPRCGDARKKAGRFGQRFLSRWRAKEVSSYCEIGKHTSAEPHPEGGCFYEGALRLLNRNTGCIAADR